MQEIEIGMWAVAIASLIGTIANIYHKRWCFRIWFYCNVAWTIYDIYKEAYPQACLMAVYAILAVYGWYVWGKAKKPVKRKPTRKSRGGGQ